MSNHSLQAVIGIGSNSTRLLVARHDSGDLIAVRRMERITRLAGYKITASGIPLLDPQAIEDTLAAAREYLEVIEQLGAPLVGVLATEAVRAAADSADLTAALSATVGLPVTILSGEEEAALGWRAVIADYASVEGSLGVIDIGGGSNDLSVGHPSESKPHSVLSIPSGARIAMQRFGLNRPVEYSKTSGIIASLRIEMHDGAAAMQPRPHTAVAIGGTAEVLASVYTTLEKSAPDGRTPLDRDWLGGFVMRLAALPTEGRVEMGVPRDRADIAPAGGAILLVLLDAWGLQKFHVSERNILDGYLLQKP